MIFKIILCNRSEDQLQDARVHCVVLKVRAVPLSTTPQTGKQKEAQSNQMLPTRRSKRIRSLRTQQRADTRPLTQNLPTASGVLVPRSDLDAMSNVPPMSSQRRTYAFDLGSGHPKVSDAP